MSPRVARHWLVVLLLVVAVAALASATLLPPSEHPANTLVVAHRSTIGSGLAPLPTFDSQDRFGDALIACDPTGGGNEALVVGIPGRNAKEGGMMTIAIDPLSLAVTNNVLIDEVTHPAIDITDDIDMAQSVLCGTDYNSDGVRDLLVSLPGDSGDAGSVRAMFLTSDLDLVSDEWWNGWWTVGLPEATVAGERFGQHMTVVGDIDGNGFIDYAVGSCGANSNDGAVTVLFAATATAIGSGVRTTRTLNAPPSLVLDAGANFCGVQGIGDVDHDGIPDLVVGAKGHGAYGSIWVAFLHANGTFREVSEIPANDDLDGGGFPAGMAAKFGWNLANLGDIDGDGINEIGVGASQYDYPSVHLGGFFVISVNASGALQWSRAFSSGINGVHNLTAFAEFGSALTVIHTKPESLLDDYGGSVVLAVGEPGFSTHRGQVHLFDLPYRRDNVSFVDGDAADDPTVAVEFVTLWAAGTNVTLDIRTTVAAGNHSLGTRTVHIGYDGVAMVDLTTLGLPDGAYRNDSVEVFLTAAGVGGTHPVRIGASSVASAALCPPIPGGPDFVLQSGSYGERVNVSWLPFTDWGSSVQACGWDTRSVVCSYKVNSGPVVNHTINGAMALAQPWWVIDTEPGDVVEVAMGAQRGDAYWEVWSPLQPVVATPVTSAPASLAVECAMAGAVALNWTAPIAFNGFPTTAYRLYRVNDSVEVCSVLDFNCTDGTPLVPDTAYTYQVVSVNDHGESRATALTVDVVAPPPATALEVAPDLVDPHSIFAAWNHTDACGMEPIVQTVSVSSDASFIANAVNYTVAPVASTTLLPIADAVALAPTVYIRVVTSYSPGMEAVSFPTAVSLVPPPAPMGLAIVRHDELGRVDFTWDAPSVLHSQVRPIGYDLEVTMDATVTTLVVAEPTLLSANASLLPAYATVSARVRSRSAAGAGAWSAAVVSEPPPVASTPAPDAPLPPTWVEASLVTPNTVEVTWGASPGHGDTVALYSITYGTLTSTGLAAPAVFTVFAAAGSSPATVTARVEDLDPGITYGFDVRSAAGGSGVDSAAVRAVVFVQWPIFTELSPQPVLSLAGGALDLIGAGLGFGAAVSIAGVRLNTSQVTYVSSNVVSIAFPPRDEPGYVDISLTNTNGANLFLAAAVYYAATDCLAPGTFGNVGGDERGGLGSRDSGCAECPDHATCPGGGRAWPDPGYWAPNETSGQMVLCVPDFKCLGGADSACAEGYGGFVCSSCAAGYYYTDGFCAVCDSPTVDVSLRVIDGLFLIVMVALITCAPRPFLRRFAFWLTMFQFVRLMTATARGGFSVELGLAVRGLALTTGEGLRQASPCDVHAHAFVYQYYGQLGALYAAVLGLFLLLCAVYAWKRWGTCPRACKRAKPSRLSRDLGALERADRVVEGMIICAVYTQAAAVSLAVRAMACTSTYAGTVLVADATLLCWEGPHAWMFIVGLVVVLGHGLGVPFVLGLRLRTLRERLATDRRVQDRYGFLFLMFHNREPFFLTYWMVFVTCLLGVLHLFQASIGAVFAFAGFLVLIFAGLVSARRPFRKASWNVAFTLLIFVGLVAVFINVFKSISDDQLALSVATVGILVLTAGLLFAFCFNVVRPVDDDDLVELIPGRGSFHHRADGGAAAAGSSTAPNAGVSVPAIKRFSLVRAGRIPAYNSKSESVSTAEWDDGVVSPRLSVADSEMDSDLAIDNSSSASSGDDDDDDDDDDDLFLVRGAEEARLIRMDILGTPRSVDNRGSTGSLKSGRRSLSDSFAQLPIVRIQERRQIERRVAAARSRSKHSHRYATGSRRPGALQQRSERRSETSPDLQDSFNRVQSLSTIPTDPDSGAVVMDDDPGVLSDGGRPIRSERAAASVSPERSRSRRRYQRRTQSSRQSQRRTQSSRQSRFAYTLEKAMASAGGTGSTSTVRTARRPSQ